MNESKPPYPPDFKEYEIRTDNVGGTSPLFMGAGMTLRDYFAAQALVGAMAHYAGSPQEISGEYISKMCYGHADAMLKERAK
jgi:hypothetical protein